jgi:NAD-dependent deacetylase
LYDLFLAGDPSPAFLLPSEAEGLPKDPNPLGDPNPLDLKALCDYFVTSEVSMSQANLFSDELLDKLSGAASVAVLTGAGISAESGVPTFRGEDGLWKKFRPQELATVDAFMRNPALVWDWYQHRRKLLFAVQPNPGHLALRDLEERCQDFTLITQNIDGLHQKAGSQRVLELHGNIRRNRCMACGRTYEDVDLREDRSVPLCRCGGKIRPDVVWFGESLPRQTLEQAFLASTRCQVFFSIGTSAVVYPAASLPMLALQGGAYVVEINIEPTDLSPQANQFIRGRSGEVLPPLLRALARREGPVPQSGRIDHRP